MTPPTTAGERALDLQAALLDLARDAIYVRDAERRITYWNHGAEHSYGWTREEAIGRVSYELLQTEFPEPIETIEAELRHFGHWDGELVQHTKAGDRRLVSSRWVVVLTDAGAIDSVMAINTDITAAKLAETRLAQRSAELEELTHQLTRSNAELEQFAYAASHDLSEPLRAISGPISLLARRYRGRLGPDADQYIDFATDGCARMQSLIDDILAYSRVDQVDCDPEPVDTDALLSAAILALGPTVAERGAEVTRGHLPMVDAAPTQIISLFQNLISNAIKFTAADVSPRVHVDCRREGDLWRFTVADNGIGIDARYRPRVFEMFKRLHPRDVYPGTGIGLALCAKIVERHGGAIGLDESRPGSGSTFWFTLPIRTQGE